MLAKSQRLNLTKDFRWVRAGKRVETPHFKIFFRVGDQTTPRVGIALVSKLFKRAHDRNRARRLTSKAIEQNYPGLPKKINLVIMPKGPILEKKANDLAREIKDVKNIFTAD